MPAASKFQSLAVIVPAHNAGKTILATLASIQASFNLFNSSALGKGVSARAVIVDDGSSDDTAGKARDFCAYHPGFELAQTGANRGAGFSRNLGVNTAGTDLLFFCDADDLFFENHVLTCYKMLHDHPGADAVKTGVFTKETLHPHFEKVVQTSLPLNLCIKRKCHEFIGGFSEDEGYRIYGGEDTAYILMVGYFFKMIFCDVKTVEYVRCPGNSFDRQLRKFQNPPGTVPDYDNPEQQRAHEAMWKVFQEKLARLQQKPLPADTA